jgi:hypothetical protein
VYFSIPRRRFLVKTLLLVWVIRLGLWLIPFRTLRRLIDKVAGNPGESRHTGWPTAGQIAGTVELASRYVPKATCLTQALTTQLLLGRYGHPAALHIGVARSEMGEFQAHAWVESNGVVVIGGSKSELEHYTPLLAFEGRGQ